MNKHIVEANSCLKQNVVGFYNCDYSNMRDRGYSYFLNELKNDESNLSSWQLNKAKEKLESILKEDLPDVLRSMGWNQATVCVVPRAKPMSFYNANQLYFSDSVGSVTNILENLHNGCSFINRHSKTRTTHRHFTDTIGSMPYCGITNDTCHISSDVSGKRIILVDDIYTKTINIDEDVIQALFDKGAESVCLYTVAKTVKKYH